MKFFLICFTACCLILSSCRKSPISPDSDPSETAPPSTSTNNLSQRMADSLYKYAQQIYYWNTLLPDSATFKPLGYVNSDDTLAGLRAELLAITQTNTFEPYTYIDENGQQAIGSKYSYIEKTADLYGGGGTTGNIISDQNAVTDLKMTLDGQDNDLGFNVGIVPVFFADGSPGALKYNDRDSNVLFVRMVTKNSPAYNAGLRRGDLISAINLTNWSYDNNQSAILQALAGDNIKLTRLRPSTNAKDTLNITKAVFTFNPVMKDTVLTYGAKKIGYIAYQSFTTRTNSVPALNAAFSKFSGVTDVVVDLRFNGGGYVDVAAHLINLLAPQNKNGTEAFSEHYNATMQRGEATILRNQPVYINNVRQPNTYYDLSYALADNKTNVNKGGASASVNKSNEIKNIYFIVSDGTASASELVINSLKAFDATTKVTLVGAIFSADGKLTYGKPVGFFEVRIGQYSTYMASFETKNALGQGGYYEGIETNYQAFDDVCYDLGNPNEACFKSALFQITGDSRFAQTTSIRSVYGTRPIFKAIGNPVKIHDMIVEP